MVIFLPVWLFEKGAKNRPPFAPEKGVENDTLFVPQKYQNPKPN